MSKHRGYLIGGVILLLIIIVLSSYVLQRPSESQQPLVTAVIDSGDIEKTVLATGILKPSLQVNVGAQVNGQLKKLYVKQGDSVSRGQLLAEIDPTLQQNALRNAKAQLQSAKAQEKAAQALLRQYFLELRRQQQMDAEGAGIKANLEKAQAQYQSQQSQLQVSKAQIIQAEMAVETARANLGYTRIVAPIDGEVLGIVTKEGQTIVSSQSAPTILVLADLNTMTVHTRISETDILKVKTGQPLWFYVIADADVRYHSVMGAIQQAPAEALAESSASSSASQSAVYYNGTFSIANHKRQLHTSMTAQVFIITAQAKNVVRLPQAALGQVMGKDTYQVQVMLEGQVQQRLVRIGIRDSQFVEVKEGVQVGDRVVLPGQGIGGARGL